MAAIAKSVQFQRYTSRLVQELWLQLGEAKNRGDSRSARRTMDLYQGLASLDQRCRAIHDGHIADAPDADEVQAFGENAFARN